MVDIQRVDKQVLDKADGAKELSEDERLKKLMSGDEEEEAGGLPKLTTKDLEDLDLSLPEEFQADSMAEELLSYKSLYQRSRVGWQAARNSGDRQRAETLYRQMAYARLGAALVTSQYPDAVKLADDIAKARVIDARNRRESLMEEE